VTEPFEADASSPDDVRDTRPGPWTITTWLVVLNVGVFVLGHFLVPPRVNAVRQVMLPSPVDRALWFSFVDAVGHFEIWRFLTFQFVHASLMHLAGNLLGLISLGPVVEEYLGRRRFLAFYLLCGAMGPLGFLVLQALGQNATPNATLVGASAGVFGVLVGAALVAPDAWVQLIFPPTPIRLRTAAMLMLCVAVFTVFAYGRDGRHNAGGEAAHLGGAAMGYALIRRREWLDWAERWGPAPRRR
jgi:membrane associated rhomboid family serine protease